MCSLFQNSISAIKEKCCMCLVIFIDLEFRYIDIIYNNY